MPAGTVISGKTLKKDAVALASWLQVSGHKIEVSYKVGFNTTADSEIILVHLLASDFLIVECEDQKAQ